MSLVLSSQQSIQGDPRVDFLLPTGILIMLECRSEHTVSEIKDRLWAEAKKLPLFQQLRQSEWYVFVFVNRKAQLEECLDETQRLSDLQMYKPLFKVVEKKGNEAEKRLSNDISWLIGRQLKDFENSRDPEVHDFRISMVEKCRLAIEGRTNFTWLDKLFYIYPPSLENSQSITPVLETKLTPQGEFRIHVDFSGLGRRGQTSTILVHYADRPTTAVERALRKVTRSEGEEKEHPNTDNYVLKVCGMEEYIVGDYPLIQFKYIRHPVSKGIGATLTMVQKSSVKVELEPEEFVPPTTPKKEHRELPNEVTSLWDIDGKFSLKVIDARSLNVAKDATIQVYAGLYHGSEALCKAESTRNVHQEVVDHNPVWNWNENIEFTINIRDLPQGTRLCLTIYAVFGEKNKKRKRRGEEKVPLAWVNLPLFDYLNMLCTGNKTLHCWHVNAEDPLEDLLNPIGTVSTNTNIADAPCLQIHFKDYSSPSKPTIYPPFEKVLEIASAEMKQYNEEQLPKAYEQELQDIVERDPLAPLFEQDKELVWRFRMRLIENSSALPKLLNSVKWNQHTDVAVLQSILLACKPLQPEEALELLDYAYQDPYVRTFAVRCINQLDDTELFQYMLQLCQALKYESHLNCALVHFLLERAWKNRAIGHYLFWHLRAEMDIPEVSIRFGLMLEAYLRGSINHMPDLRRQMDAIGKMRSISELLHSKSFKDRDRREKARDAMLQLLSQQAYKNALSYCVSTINPKLLLGEIKDKECRFYDSKMRPLLMVYGNPDPSVTPQDVRVIFKNGDDLRQDMLTLQIIGIMDNIWQQEGLDLRLLPYGCISTGARVGFIECITQCETIANIQKNYRRSGPKLSLWDSNLLYQYLKEKNPLEAQLLKATEAFCLSCAGYCVATYVLGIGDRHSDNIMVKENGQLFHVDFGHFLGNFKVKFGVRRERVPFVLASDFEIVIDKHFGFSRFSALCEEAYLCLRRKAHLLINLLAMMLQTGIPELRSIDDLNYVREALVLGESEQTAKDHFRTKLQDARRNAWSTSLNWYVHGLAKDNRP